MTVGYAEAAKRMSRLAFEDPLTGLANRRALELRLDVLFPAQGGHAGGDLSLILCDLDAFKELNDRDGTRRATRRCRPSRAC